MLTIIVATAIAVGLACIVLTKSQMTDSSQLRQPRPALLTIGVQIICGNCSGDDELPLKTYIDRSGNCAACGGHSYVLASALAATGVVARAARLREARFSSTNGRVIPFEAPSSRTSRSTRIAV